MKKPSRPEVVHAVEEDLPAEAAERISQVAAAGGVIVFPTDTFYGLGVDPFSQKALDLLFRLKGRSRSQPMLVLLDRVENAYRFAAAVTPLHRALMKRFWPGPLTLLFPAREGLPRGVTSDKGEVALRVPGSGLCRRILQSAGGALTGTSANPSGGENPVDPGKAAALLGRGVDLVVDGGTLSAKAVSTLLALEGERPVIVREGAVSMKEVEEFLDSLVQGGGFPVDKGGAG